MSVNYRLLRTVVGTQAKKQMLEAAETAARLDFNVKKGQFLQEFESHPVSQEINEGPRALSSFVSDTEGNLFSLLGFDKSQKPITALKNFLKQSIILRKTKFSKMDGDKAIFETQVEIPTNKDIDEFASSDSNTSLKTWDSRSFVRMIENGVPGLPRYLFSLVKNLKNSRSGTAIQVKNNLRGGSVGRISYLSSLLSRFRRNITGER